MEERLKREATRELTTEEVEKACNSMESLKEEDREDMLELIDPDTMGYHGKEGISDGTCDQ